MSFSFDKDNSYIKSARIYILRPGGNRWNHQKEKLHRNSRNHRPHPWWRWLLRRPPGGWPWWGGSARKSGGSTTEQQPNVFLRRLADEMRNTCMKNWLLAAVSRTQSWLQNASRKKSTVWHTCDVDIHVSHVRQSCDQSRDHTHCPWSFPSPWVDWDTCVRTSRIFVENF